MAAADHLQFHDRPPAWRMCARLAEADLPSIRTSTLADRFVPPRPAVLGIDQQQHRQRDDQKHEADDRQIGDLAAAPRRPVDGIEHGRGHQPGEHQRRAPDDRIAPGQLAQLARGRPRSESCRPRSRRPPSTPTARSTRLLTFSSHSRLGSRKPGDGRQLALQPAGLHQVHQAGHETDHHGHGAQQQEDAVHGAPHARRRARRERRRDRPAPPRPPAPAPAAA